MWFRVLKRLVLVQAAVWSVAESVAEANQTCYYPGGRVASGDTPCNASGEFSACCHSQDICLDNGLCYNQVTLNGMITRASCTDSTWESDSCARHCAKSFINRGSPLVPITDTAPFRYCCGFGYNAATNECCNFSFDEATNQCNETRSSGRDPPINVRVGRVIFNRASGSTSPNNNASTETATAKTDQPCPTTPTDQHKSCHETKVGAGVGVPLGVALLLTFGMLWLQRRQYKRLAERSGAVTLEIDGSPIKAEEWRTPQLQVPRVKEMAGSDVSELESRG